MSRTTCRRAAKRPALSTAARAVALVAAPLFVLPGCIIQDIHDELEQSNLALADTNRNLEAVTARLDQTIGILNERLAKIEVTNERLESTAARLEALDSINRSLLALDAHLASIRRTLENINDFVPLIDVVDPAPIQPAPPVPPQNAQP